VTALGAAWTGAVALSAAAWAWVLVALARAARGIGTLAGAPPARRAGAPWPPLTVVVPCRNEAGAVEAAMRSVLGQDYPVLEVVAVDDRSTDETGAILDRLGTEDPRLHAVHVESLPEGWLGKNHACHVGAGAATGDWLLFTDADVWFAPDALRRAVAYAEARHLGHLVALPRLVAPGFWERSFVAAFAIYFSLKLRMDELARRGSSAFVGAGAFNLVERRAYRQVGGHTRLAMEVVDDVKLGLVLRRSGVRQGVVDSAGLVTVRWQPGFRASVRGLVKNAFAAAEWRWRVALVGAAKVGLVSIVPLAAVLLAPGPAARRIGVLVLAVSMAVHAAAARRATGGSGIEGIAFPVASAVLVGVVLWSAAAATLRGGIVWRGTRYPLDALRAGCVRESDWPATRAVGLEEERARP
jgi:Glycosyl transferase family 2